MEDWFVLFMLSVGLARVSAQDLGPHSPGTEGGIRLVGGSAPGTGTVLIYHDHKWGKVCDDGWNLQAAHVVCKSLGYARALMAATSSHFGGDFSEYGKWNGCRVGIGGNDGKDTGRNHSKGIDAHFRKGLDVTGVEGH